LEYENVFGALSVESARESVSSVVHFPLYFWGRVGLGLFG
jgi:hypothetical protein